MVVAEGLLDAFAYGLQAREVDDGVDLVLGEDFLQALPVQKVGFVEFEVLAGDLPDVVQGFGLGVDEVVHDDDVLACIEKLHAGVGADVPGAAGN